jgi:NAD(P)-dependent dehydrogenase (short-subunit alcohol dehydrogenase family)
MDFSHQLFRNGIIFIDRMGCGSSYDASDGPKIVVVFGATGLLGGAIARRLLQEPFLYKVRCVTRRSSSDKARQLAEHGKKYIENRTILLSNSSCDQLGLTNLLH